MARAALGSRRPHGRGGGAVRDTNAPAPHPRTSPSHDRRVANQDPPTCGRTYATAAHPGADRCLLASGDARRSPGRILRSKPQHPARRRSLSQAIRRRSQRPSCSSSTAALSDQRAPESRSTRVLRWTTTSGRGERGGLLHRRGGPQADAPRRGRRPGRDVAPRGEAAAVAGVRSACSARTVVPRASGRAAPRLIEATVRGRGSAPVLPPKRTRRDRGLRDARNVILVAVDGHRGGIRPGDRVAHQRLR